MRLLPLLLILACGHLSAIEHVAAVCGKPELVPATVDLVVFVGDILASGASDAQVAASLDGLKTLGEDALLCAVQHWADAPTALEAASPMISGWKGVADAGAPIVYSRTQARALAYLRSR